MELWPRDFREEAAAAATNKRKKTRNRFEREPGWETVDLSGGRIGAATLAPYQNRLEWVFTKPTDAPRCRLNVMHTGTKVFPATASPKLTPPMLSAQRLAELGTNFLRESYPDVDIPAEIIEREYPDPRISPDQYDSFFGNRLSYVSIPEEDTQDVIKFLAFPMGETLQQLNLSPMFLTEEGNSELLPFTTSTLSFDTPVAQLESLHVSREPTSTQGPVSLVVRTYGKATFFRITTTHNFYYPDRLQHTRAKCIPLAFMDSSKTGGQAIVDISLKDNKNECLFVNDVGQVYSTCFEVGGTLNCTAVSTSISSEDPFWRVKWSYGIVDALLISKDALSLLDLRSPSLQIAWKGLNHAECITHLEGALGPSLPCITTTERVLWFDERNYKTPLLSYAHGRRSDRSLKSITTEVGDGLLTFLASDTNSLVTVYDVSRNGSDLAQSFQNPIDLKLGHELVSNSMRRIGVLAVPKLGNNNENICLFEVIENGAVFVSEFCDEAADTSEPLHIDRGSSWKNLEEQAETLTLDVGHLGKRKCIVEDLSMPYDKLFVAPADQDRVIRSSMEDTYDLLDRMKRFRQESDISLEHTLTLFDIAMMCGEPPRELARAEFFSGSPLDTKQGRFVALNGRIPLRQIKEGTSWYSNYSNTFARLGTELPNGEDMTADSFRKYNHPHDSNTVVSSSVLQLETEACEELALDMILGSHVFVPEDFTNDLAPSTHQRAGDSSGLAAVTEALSLGPPEPPLFRFVSVKPIDPSTRSGETSQGASLLPVGARALLQEWAVGDNPDSYVYQNPYNRSQDDNSEAPAQPRRRKRDRTLDNTQTMRETLPLTQPPAILASAPPMILSQRERVRFSSPIENTYPDMYQGSLPSTLDPVPQSSQVMLPSTQQLPGRFGGRLSTGRKPPKKRIGGF